MDASAHPHGTRRGDGRGHTEPAADPDATVEFALADLDAARDHADGDTDPHVRRAS